MILTVDDYVESLDNTLHKYAFPAHNKNVITDLLKGIASDFRYTQLGSILYNPIYKHEKSGSCVTAMYADPQYQYLIPFHDYTCFSGGTIYDHNALAELYSELPEGSSIITDTLGLTEQPSTFDNHFTWANSPIAIIDDFEDYLTSLERKRRYAVKQGIKSELTLKFLGSIRESRDQYIDWLYQIFKYDNFPHALRAYLMVESANACYPTRVPHVGLFDGDKLLIALFMVKTGNHWFFATTVKNPYEDTRDAGVTALSKLLLAAYEKEGSLVFDPTCVQNPFADPHSTDIYKRKFVNTDRYAPLIYMDTDAAQDERIKPPYFDGKTWILPQKPVFIDQFELKNSP